MKTIKSFGCSFIYGTDLIDADLKGPNAVIGFGPSNSTWPALIANQVGFAYKCHALPGQGNFKIFCDIVANSYHDDQSIFLINWTWIDRFDYVDTHERWATLRPSEEGSLQDYYYRNFHSQLKDMITSASYIISAAEHLNSLNCPYIMTFMDYNLLTPLNPKWHNPRYLEVMQQKLQTVLTNFEGKNFLDWSQTRNFRISDDWHPLEDAHQAAADYLLPLVQKLL